MRKNLLGLTAALFLTLCLTATAFAAGLKDGAYLVDVTMTGGTGKVTMESPCRLTVAGGKMTATVVLTSAHYEYMRLGDDKYDATHGDGASVFEIPVTLDTDIDVAAQTVAMSTPHEVVYQLHFTSASAKREGGSQNSMVLPVSIGCGAVVVLAVAVVVWKKKRG
ncbi:MAG: hypothetical protein VB023_08565 [Oscillibacter sp.]|nr:hypothetical protein [Oscillibacter sp.]